MKSKFLETKPVITKTNSFFEEWLLEQDYSAVSDFYPAAVLASDLVKDFLEEYPDLRKERTMIRRHAKAIGYVSDYTDEQEETDYCNTDDTD